MFSYSPVLFCFVAKDYERPEEEIDPIKYRTDQLESDTLSISKVNWKEMFTDTVQMIIKHCLGIIILKQV
ncbi:hypothetical protein [Psychroflexus torquis]|uniref:hypothetical protein n=1 Tax=Psychroflexus torquis TaxID=57029 RepID=UPI0000D53C75|nr:hypothetical protein [Psychroflexus torquis]